MYELTIFLQLHVAYNNVEFYKTFHDYNNVRSLL